MHRKKNGREYYTFPGGGLEAGETPEQGCVREVLEETSIQVRLVRRVPELDWIADDKSHIHFLCEYISGEPKLGVGTDESAAMADSTSNNWYNPEWIGMSDWPKVPMYPEKAKEVLSSIP
jgi:ADP-ribose pyrophosphatase YjhB (NUDIX family)